MEAVWPGSYQDCFWACKREGFSCQLDFTAIRNVKKWGNSCTASEILWYKWSDGLAMLARIVGRWESVRFLSWYFLELTYSKAEKQFFLTIVKAKIWCENSRALGFDEAKPKGECFSDQAFTLWHHQYVRPKCPIPTWSTNVEYKI